jgi:hypothetical protein
MSTVKTVIIVILAFVVAGLVFSVVGFVFSAVHLIFDLLVLAALGYLAYRLFRKS